MNLNTVLKLLVGAGLTWLVYEIAKSMTKTEENKEGNAMLSAALAGLGLISFDASQKNTVHYTLYRDGKRVYDGITKESRRAIRMAEHRASGKKFDRVRFSQEATYRNEALEREERLIKRHKPEYNIQHNS